MKYFFVLTAFIVATNALAMTHFLTDEWNDGGDHFCKYDNGTVLNVGYKNCPLSI